MSASKAPYTFPTLLLALAALTGTTACRPPDAGRATAGARAFLRIVAAEDARPAGNPRLQVLVDGTRAGAPALRAVAVRALGRLENPALSGHVLPLLDDPEPAVRGQAANALAQAYRGTSGEPAAGPLLRRLAAERDPWVRGVIGRSLGRLRLGDARRREAERALLSMSRRRNGGWPPEAELVGAALALQSFVRAGRGRAAGRAVRARLRELARYAPPGGPTDSSARVRVVALTALGAAGDVTAEVVAAGLGDPDGRVRAAAAADLTRMGGAPPDELVDRALADAAAAVRTEAVRALAGAERTQERCDRLRAAAAADAATVVRLAALDALAQPCPGRATQLRLLEATAFALPPSGGDWHAAAHALVSLASVDPSRAATLLPPFSAHPNPFVRTWAARAAALVASTGTLRALAADPDANTRAEALDGLAHVSGRAADPALIGALGRDDAPQVLLVAARRLPGTGSTVAARQAALDAIARVGRAHRQTMRDPRLALLELVDSLGDAAVTPEVEPLLRDYDEAVASRAARALQRWTGRPYLAAPRGSGRLPLPTPAELRALASSEVVLHMARGGEIRIRLLPIEAPTNAFRLYELARSGTLDGLTFHRVAPNFVIQGGSPLANEYAGHGAFTRDEVGLAVQWRGTVGVSTRGRDTGDGQLYVNLMDNTRLDHEYTTMGFVSAGMDVVDAVLEGDVIERAEVRPAS